MITVLAGGVGAARLLTGLVQVFTPDEITAIVNTADDEVINGLSVSPDLDTVTYTLAEAIDPTKGWGLIDESWHAMEAMTRYVSVRPAASEAANTWFRLGDRDLATHLYRSTRLAEGATLTTVTDEISRAWNVQVRLLPMTDDRVATRLSLASQDAQEVSFQDYFVKRQHSVAISSIRYDGCDTARPNPLALDAIDHAERIIFAPSNPVLSIGPILSLSGMRDRLTTRRKDVVAISPIIDGVALKGPADRLLNELGFESSVVGIARLYSELVSALVIDISDAHHRSAIEACGLRCIVTQTVMRTPSDAALLARTIDEETR